MNILGIGPLEILFVVLIGILVLGPEGMVETGRKLGQFIHSVATSKWWQSVQSGVDEVQNLPHKLMREAEFEEWNKLYHIEEKDFPAPKNNPPLGQTSWAGAPNPADVEAEEEQTPSLGENQAG
ncbi:MAG: hypothetical protein R6U57_06065 [Anaerolineales bacterium]